MKCTNCSSDKTVKRGFRQTNQGKKQLYLCKSCKRKFVTGLKKHRYPESVIKEAAKMRANGKKLREIQLWLDSRGYKTSLWTISKWDRKFNK